MKKHQQPWSGEVIYDSQVNGVQDHLDSISYSVSLPLYCGLSLTLLTNVREEKKKKQKTKQTMSPTQTAFSVSPSSTFCVRSSVSQLTEKRVEGETAEE